MTCAHCGCALMRYSLDWLGLVCANPSCRQPREITSPLAAPEAPDSSGVATLAERPILGDSFGELVGGKVWT